MNLALFVRVFLGFLVDALWVLVLVRVVLSWVRPGRQGAFGQFVYEATEWLLGPIRRILPASGPLDLSPMVAVLVLFLLARALGLP